MRKLPATVLVCTALSVVLPLSGCGGDGTGASILDQTSDSAPVGGVDLSAVEFHDLTGEESVQVDALDNVFKAKYVEVAAGTTVRFRNDGRNSHNVLPVVKEAFSAVEAPDFEPGVDTTITFDEPGDYPYFCSLHGTTTKGMTGAIRVIPSDGQVP